MNIIKRIIVLMITAFTIFVFEFNYSVYANQDDEIEIVDTEKQDSEDIEDVKDLKGACDNAEAILQHEYIELYCEAESLNQLQNAYNDGINYLQEAQPSIDVTNKYVDAINDAISSLKKKEVFISGAYQIFDVHSDNELSFVIDLPMEAIAIYSEKLGDSINLYVDENTNPVDASYFVLEEIELNKTKLTFTDEFIQSISVARHYLHIYIFGDKNLEVSTEFTLRMAAKYETMRIGSETELVPMYVSADNVSDWKAKAKTWTSSNENIATVDENGVALGKEIGQAEVRATYEDGTFDAWIVTVDGYNGIFVTDDFGDYSDGTKQPINWVTVGKSGIDFAVVRYAVNTDNGEPNVIIYAGNTTLADILKAAKENNIKIGIEFKTTAKNKEEAIAEANYLIKNLAEYKDAIDLPIMYNVLQFKDYPVLKSMFPDIFITDDDCNDLTKLNQISPVITEIISAFNNRMSEAGYKTMIYFSIYAANAFDVKALHDEGIGLVFYDCDSDDYPTIAPIIKDSATADIWFYAGDRYVAGATNSGGRTWMLLGYNEYLDTVVKEERSDDENEGKSDDNKSEGDIDFKDSEEEIRGGSTDDDTDVIKDEEKVTELTENVENNENESEVTYIQLYDIQEKNINNAQKEIASENADNANDEVVTTTGDVATEQNENKENNNANIALYIGIAAAIAAVAAGVVSFVVYKSRAKKK